MNALVPIDAIPSGALTVAEIDATMAYAEAEKVPATREAYASDWRDFSIWCVARGATPLPAHVGIVAAYLSWLADSGRKSSTIGKRDRALLCLGFAGAFRRSELCALEVADLTEVPNGLRILIRRSKGDQEGQGQEVAIPHGYRLRPVEAVQAWLAAAEVSAGPVFRAVALGGKVSDVALADDSAERIVKRYAERVGLDPAAYSGHSLRSGFLTSAAEAGASIWKLSEVSRHKSLATLRGSVRRVGLFREHAGAAFL